MIVISLPEIPPNVLADVEDLLDSARLRYRVSAQEDPTKPGLGGFRRTDPDTSRLAAVQVYPRTGTQRERVLMAIHGAGDTGAIPYEIEAATGINYRSLTPRIGELKAGGWVAGTGDTRTGNMGAEQEILVVTEKTRDFIWSRR